jgi:hypothetical protein
MSRYKCIDLFTRTFRAVNFDRDLATLFFVQGEFSLSVFRVHCFIFCGTGGAGFLIL